MSSSYRPRRTRIYGANYNIGESYYKKQLDELDHKRGVGRLSTPTVATNHLADDFKLPEPLFRNDLAEDRFSSLPKRAMSYEPSSTAFDEEFGNSALAKRISAVKFGLAEDAEFSAPRHRANKKHLDAIELDNDDSFSFLKPRDTKKRFEAYDVDKEASDGFVSRRLKIKTGILREEHSSEAEAASQRVRATRSRLADLESEMENISLKQNERKERSLNLKRLLNDCDDMKAIEY